MKVTNEQILELYNIGLSDKEIAEKLNVNTDLIIKRRCKLNLVANNIRLTYSLNDYETEIIIGTLLGDSCIRYVHNACLYPSLTFTHCEKQKEWMEWKSEKLKNIKSSSKGYSKNSYFKGIKVIEYQFTGKNMKCLVEFEKEFYINRIKLIPIEFIKDKISDLSIFCWYMDDGSYDISSNSYIFNTQSFEKENLNEFIDLLKERFNLNFTIKSDNTLYLRHCSNSILTNILLKYNECNSMSYKISECRHKIPLNGVSPENGLSAVLNQVETLVKA